MNLPEIAVRNSLFAFACKYAAQTPPEGFKPERLHLWLCQTIQDAIQNKKRIVITVPPQHGKSTIASVYATIWYLWNNPNRNVGLISYAADLAETKSLQARNLARIAIDSKLSSEASSRRNWALTGALDYSFRARGVGGAITGSPIDLLILDDLIKNHEEAESTTQRDKLWSYLESTIHTRLTKDSAVIAILTRWHLDDYASKLHTKWNWPLYNIPAICEYSDTDLLGRQKGEVAAPELKPQEMLEQIKRDTSAYVWSSLFQGNPTSHEATRIRREWFKYYPETDIDRIAARYNIYQTVDTSGTQEEYSDYFVVLTFAFVMKTIDGTIIESEPEYLKAVKDKKEFIRHIYVLDVYRKKFETTEHEEALRIMREKWRPIIQYVEKKTFGLNIIQNAKAKHLPVEPLEADVSKFLRSERISVYYKNGQVWHPQKADWLETFEDEISNFPVSRHDDQFDCIAYAGIVAANKKI